MPENIPKEILLRCYGYKTRHGSWITSCIDLSLMVERPSLEESRQALHEQIDLYIESVLDTEDRISFLLIASQSPMAGDNSLPFISFACTIACKIIKFEGICRRDIRL